MPVTGTDQKVAKGIPGSLGPRRPDAGRFPLLTLLPEPVLQANANLMLPHSAVTQAEGLSLAPVLPVPPAQTHRR